MDSGHDDAAHGAFLAGLLPWPAGGGKYGRRADPATGAGLGVDPAPWRQPAPVGRSLFDQLFAVSAKRQSAHRLPFPFERLLARSMPNWPARSGQRPAPANRRVLIPLGRSLQRTAAAPDYFRLPARGGRGRRPPAPGSPYCSRTGCTSATRKNRRARSHQLQRGRRPLRVPAGQGLPGRRQPQVFYANRTLCFACHQNGAPIFSRALWDETNANPQAPRCSLARADASTALPRRRGVDIPYAIDNATERANGFA
jgi:hypothetical protein